MPTTKYYDNTRIGDHRRCNRLHYFRHKRHWRPETTGKALVFGACWHDAMDSVWANIYKTNDDTVVRLAAFDAFMASWTGEWGLLPMEQMDDDEIKKLGARTPMTALEMLGNYIPTRRPLITGQMELLEIEAPFAVPLWPDRPETMYVGRIDKIVRYNGRVYGIEHKTTTEYAKATGFRRSFLQSFNPNSQVDGYLHAIHMLYGDDAKGILVDAALVHKTVHDAFKVIPIEKSIGLLDAWLWETREEIGKIERNEIYLDDHEALKNDFDNLMTTNFPDPKPFLPAFGKNTQSCSHYGGCTYHDICSIVEDPSTHDEPPGGYIYDEWSPFDVLALDKIGLEKEE